MKLLEKYQNIRKFSQKLCSHLETEDFIVQSMEDVSPIKWHLAHSSWFFENFVLKDYLPNYQLFQQEFLFLFNSYYNGASKNQSIYPRPLRGILSRPTVQQIWNYRDYVDQFMLQLIQNIPSNYPDRDPQQLKISYLVLTGLNHEQQHQELILMDIKHIFSQNPLKPPYSQNQYPTNPPHHSPYPFNWISFQESVDHIGSDLHPNQFIYDHETPKHRVFLEPFQIASRLVTNAEYLNFIQDGGYTTSQLWLSEGWDTLKKYHWSAPLYWENQNNHWSSMTLYGMQQLNPHEPVSHVSYYEADAYARWAKARLPLESEWEIVAKYYPVQGNFVESQMFKPNPPNDLNSPVTQLYGDLWEWTMSHYSPYVGYSVPKGTIGEYNAKFMCNQFVLRGGSCVTSQFHIRPTYRNFFYPNSRWHFSGIRLARSVFPC